MSSGPKIVTLGCRLNAFESEIIRAKADDLSGSVIVNTCAVTAEAERQARQTIRRLRRQNPESCIIVTGCAAQLDPDRYAAMPEVDRVLGNVEKLDKAALHGMGGDVAVSDISLAQHAVSHPISGFENRTRAFLQIQQGCDHACTFCVVPSVRGPNRSMEPDRILEQARHLVENGHIELVLTGADVSSYGLDRSGLPGLGGLARRLLNEAPGLERLRLTSLDPAMVDPEVPRLLAENPRFMPHIHLSLQSADDMILKRMRRRHTRAGAERVCAKIREARPDVVFGADLIAGFPTETKAMFENTLRAIEGLGLTYLHVFPYSARPGTAAARMPQVPVDVRKARAARLRAAADAALTRFLESRIGAEAEVLAESKGRGYCPHFAVVDLPDRLPAGTLHRVRFTAVHDGRLKGELLE